ncbi:Sec1-like protein [Mycena alexandri]|uniref:Sec1-like protein n=1 Tax=Mycena alexandri TaxID=1745969 RepID=A0AAD6XCL6_9AGAR|nr:Sec1-like protein [Mycena alexandri]
MGVAASTSAEPAPAAPTLKKLRDLNFSSVGKRLEEDYKGRHQAKTVAQLRDFVGKLGGLQTDHQSLRLHIGLSELFVPLTRTDQFNKTLEIQQNLLASYEVPAQITAIEDLLAQGADMQTILRLLCLASITAGGIKLESLENLKREVLQAYGYNHLPLLLSLSAPTLAVLLPNPLPPAPEALDEVENDISFVYSGYAPISVRLVQCVAQKGGVLSNPAEKEKEKDKAGGAADGKAQGSSIKAQAHPIAGWRGFEDLVATIPGETVDIVQNGPNDGSAVATPMASLLRPMQKPTTTVVFFLGGCTYTEIAALRWVGRQNRGRKFLIATTGIINGNTLFESISSVPKLTQAGPKDAAI